MYNQIKINLPQDCNVVLASKSPRRRELLGLLFDSFDIMPSDIDESVPKGVEKGKSAEYVALKKAEAVNCGGLIIACDTVVIADGRILGKPADFDDGFNMLSLLSGRTHSVISGVAIKYGGIVRSFSQETQVTFYDMSKEEITDYLNSGEPFDKAGAYGIQGLGGLFVKEIKGDYFNVVGLPLARLRRELLSVLN